MLTRDGIAFKGTRHGLLMSLAEEEDFARILEALRTRLSESPQFFQGGPISLDLGWRTLAEEELDSLLGLFQEKGLTLQGIISASQGTRALAESRGIKAIIGRLGLAEHSGRARALKKGQPPPSRPEEETLLVRRTLRSGQRVEAPGNVVILGDVNPGAEVEAGGDVVVLGALRGAVHAGRPSNGKAQVLAWHLAPARLRIAREEMLVWDPRKSRGFEVARIQDGQVRVGPYTGSLIVQG